MIIRNHKALSLLFGASLLVLGNLSAPAQAVASATAVAGPVAGAVISGLSMNDALDKFDTIADGIIKKAEAAGNGLLIKFGNEIRLLTHNLRTIMNEQQQTLNQTLTEEQVKAFTALNNAIDNAGRILGGQMQLTEEMIRLDASRIISQVVPWIEDLDHYVSSIDGLLLYSAAPSYVLRFRGLGFGLSQGGDTSISNRLTVNGKTVDVAKNRIPLDGRLSDRVLAVSIPPETIGTFDQKRIRKVPAKLTSTVTTAAPAWKIWESDQVKTFEVPFSILLMPRTAGRIVITEQVISPSYSYSTTPVTFTSHKGQCSSGRPCNFDQKVCGGENQMIARVEGFRGHGSACVFSYPVRGGVPQGAPDAEMTDGGKCVRIRRKHDGAHGNCSVYHTVVISTIGEATADEVTGRQDVAFGDRISWTADPRNKYCHFRIEGALASGHRIAIDQTNIENKAAHPILSPLGFTPGNGPNRCSFSLELRTPTTL